MARTLTIKQRRFVKGYVETGNGTEAAMRTYDTEDRRTAWRSRLAMHELPLLSAHVLVDGQRDEQATRESGPSTSA